MRAKYVRIVCLFAISLGGSVALASQILTIKNFGEVESQAVYRGAQPTGAGLLELKLLGVRTVLDLRDDSTVPHEQTVVESLGLTFVNLPLNGFEAPSDKQINEALRILETAPRPIFVHCKHGQNRTGTVIACYRISHGWTNKKAMDEAKFYGISPLQLEMRHYISHYKAK
jgi:protein tyrosine/serine phosphatase